ncbi:MAG: hypothetical protein OEU46_02475 [Alphaproteobacteria bacterium]|nr:hypothetical protein [Alphaproteobacteria bacterium]
MHDLVPVTYRRLSHHEAVFRDCRNRALGERLRHPFRSRRTGNTGRREC